MKTPTPAQGRTAAPASDHEVHEYHYSYFRTVLQIVGLAFGGAVLVLFAIGGQAILGQLAVWLALPMVLFTAIGIIRLALRFRHGGCVLTIDREGIVDRRRGSTRIPWRAVRRLYLGPYRGSTSLLIAFHSNATLERALGRRANLNHAITKANNFIRAPGAQWGVQLGPLRCKPGEVLRIALRLHKAAVESPRESRTEDVREVSDPSAHRAR